MSAGWVGSGRGMAETSVIARHEWKGLSKMSYNLEDHTQKQKLEAAEVARRPPAIQRSARVVLMPGSYMSDALLDD